MFFLANACGIYLNIIYAIPVQLIRTFSQVHERRDEVWNHGLFIYRKNSRARLSVGAVSQRNEQVFNVVKLLKNFTELQRFRLLGELKKMKKKILQPPSNTNELLGRSAYLEEARNKPLNDLTAAIHVLKEHFVRLTDIVIYTEADVVRSAQAFFGPDEIVPMLDDGTEVY